MEAVTALGEKHDGNVMTDPSGLEMENHDSALVTEATVEPKKITYPQIVKEGRRFNIDLISKVGNELSDSILYTYVCM